MRISDWSSDVCSSDLVELRVDAGLVFDLATGEAHLRVAATAVGGAVRHGLGHHHRRWRPHFSVGAQRPYRPEFHAEGVRSEEHTSELQSLMRISSAVFCLKKKTKTTRHKLIVYTSQI